MNFSQKLKDLREENGYTRTYVAQKCDVSIQCISSLESGARSPTGSTLVALANFFQCSVDYLLGRSDDFGNVTVSGVAGEQLTQEEKELLRNYRQLNKANRMRTDAYILVRLENQQEEQPRHA